MFSYIYLGRPGQFCSVTVIYAIAAITGLLRSSHVKLPSALPPFDGSRDLDSHTLRRSCSICGESAHKQHQHINCLEEGSRRTLLYFLISSSRCLDPAGTDRQQPLSKTLYSRAGVSRMSGWPVTHEVREKGKLASQKRSAIDLYTRIDISLKS